MATPNPYEYQPITTPPGGLLASAVGTPTNPNPPINPAAYEDDDVVAQLNAITNADSGYMQLARTSGLQTAGRRGLLNSSMAAGASQAAAIAAAAPLAQQNAQQRAQRNLTRLDAGFQSERQKAGFVFEEGMQGRELASRSSLLDKQLAAEEARLGRQLSSQEAQQVREISARQEMQQTDIAAQRASQAVAIAAESERLGRQLTAQEEQQVRDIASRSSLLNTELASRENLAAQELASQMQRLLVSDAGETSRANLSAATQTQLAALSNLNENQRASLNYYLQSNQMYAQSLSNIYANKDLPAPLRDEAMKNFLALRNAGVDLPATLFGTTTNWGTGTPAAPAPTGPVTTADAYYPNGLPTAPPAPALPNMGLAPPLTTSSVAYSNPPQLDTGPAIAGVDYARTGG